MIEIPTNIIENIPVALIVAATVGLIRSVAGWLENSYIDGVVEDYELKQLAGTIIQYFATISILMLGLPAGPAAAVALVLDKGTSAIKKIGNGNNGSGEEDPTIPS
jgi:hypothetical protein